MAGLYLHIPFCVRKCGYCDFYSEDGKAGELPSFLEALHAEITLHSKEHFALTETVETVFFGGGTPSLLDPGSFGGLLESIGRTFRLADSPEITIEANPGTVDGDRLRRFRDAGVNRISLGVQSFSDAELGMLGRMHSSAGAAEAVEASRRAGFANVGLDLIFGIPGQTSKDWEGTVRTALSFDPEHVSAYALTVHPGTPLGRRIHGGEISEPDEEALTAMFQITSDLLLSAGYEHYEVSNFARPGKRCRHNMGYWTFQPYLGLGPSAHSFTGKKRSWNVASLEEYSESIRRGALPVEGSERIGRERRRLEAIALGLRCVEGVRLDWIGKKNNLPQAEGLMAESQRAAAVQRLIEDGIARIENGSLKLTERGFLLADAVAAELA
jgi:oxygen-independent coproporphyrinogen-3 oxidase